MGPNAVMGLSELAGALRKAGYPTTQAILAKGCRENRLGCCKRENGRKWFAMLKDGESFARKATQTNQIEKELHPETAKFVLDLETKALNRKKEAAFGLKGNAAIESYNVR